MTNKSLSVMGISAALVLLRPVSAWGQETARNSPLGDLLDSLVISPATVAIAYAAIIALIAVGVIFWLFGSQLHRLALTVVGLSGGIVVGWQLGSVYDVNIVLAMTVGAAIGTSLGYWLFKFWLGLFTSLLICLVLLGLYHWQIAQPYLRNAENQTKIELAQRFWTTPTSKPATDGEAYTNLKHHLSRVSPKSWETQQEWREHVGEELSAVTDNLGFLIPHLKIGITFIVFGSLIAGFVLAFLRPDFVNIAYTAAIGALMIWASVAVLLAFRDTAQSDWLWAHSWTIWTALVLMAVVGGAIQYYMYGWGEEEDEEDEEEAEPEPDPEPKAGKSKKKPKR